jgi:hypothetical protein
VNTLTPVTAMRILVFIAFSFSLFSLEGKSNMQMPVLGEFLKFTRRSASDTVRDSASAIGTKQSLMAHRHRLDLAAVLLSPNERGAC